MFLIAKEADLQMLLTCLLKSRLTVNDRTEVPPSKSGGNNGVVYLNLVNFLRDWIAGGDVDSFGFVRIAAEAFRGAPGYIISYV